MKDNKQKMDCIFYQTIIFGYLYNNKTKEGAKVLIDSIENKMILRHDIYNSILKNILAKCQIKSSKTEIKTYETIIYKITDFMNKCAININTNILNKFA